MLKAKRHDGNRMVEAYCWYDKASRCVVSISFGAMGSANFGWSSLSVTGIAI